LDSIQSGFFTFPKKILKIFCPNFAKIAFSDQVVTERQSYQNARREAVADGPEKYFAPTLPKPRFQTK
jgi:hypothetical protein